MSRVKCSYADEYKGIRPPTCGCEVCDLKYQIAQLKLSQEDWPYPEPSVSDAKEVRERTAWGMLKCRLLLRQWGTVDEAVKNQHTPFRRPGATRKSTL